MAKDDDMAKGLRYARGGDALADARKILDELGKLAAADPEYIKELNTRVTEISCLGCSLGDLVKASLSKEISPEEGAIGMTNLCGALLLLGYTDGLSRGRSESILKAIEEGGVGLSGNN